MAKTDYKDSHFRVSTWRTQEAPEIQDFFANLPDATAAFERARESGVYRWVGLFRWVDDRIFWGNPIDYWPDDYVDHA